MYMYLIYRVYERMLYPKRKKRNYITGTYCLKSYFLSHIKNEQYM